MKIQKSKKRQVITLQAGVFAAKEVRKQCIHNPNHPAIGSEALSRLVKPRQRYSYELIVYVGLARYLDGKQRAEIQEELLEAHRIELSEGSVTNLCERFLHYLEALHLSRVPQFRQLLHEEGYPLHLDATCERGKGGLMVAVNGWRRWVLIAKRIRSENEVYIRPVVEETTALFGDPIATVHDLDDGKKALLYPFRLSHLEFFQCCQQASQKVESRVPAPRTQAERRAIKHLSTRINRLRRDRRFSTAATQLEIAWQAFCELRDVLQLTNAELPNGEARQHHMAIPAWELHRIQVIETASNAYQKELHERLANATTTSPASVILNWSVVTSRSRVTC